MEKIFNKKTIITSFVLVSVLFAPIQSFASNGGSTSICQKISKVESDIKKEQNKIKEEVQKSRQKRTEDIKEEWTKRDEQFNQERNRIDSIYKNFVVSLKAKAQTDADKKAVENFEKNIFTLLSDARNKTDDVWDKYESETLLSLSRQDSSSETYFKEIEGESTSRLGTLKTLCVGVFEEKIKDELDNIKKMKDRGMAKSSFLRKSKLEIAQLTSTRNKQIETIKKELSQKIIEAYNTLPSNLKK